MQNNFSLRREKDHFSNGVIEVLRNSHGLHILHPTSTTGMDGIAYLVLPFQDQCLHTLFRRYLGSSQASRSTTYNEHIILIWHEIPSSEMHTRGSRMHKFYTAGKRFYARLLAAFGCSQDSSVRCCGRACASTATPDRESMLPAAAVWTFLTVYSENVLRTG
jgi:hypothetical protein